MGRRIIKQGDLIKVGKEKDSLCYIIITKKDDNIIMYCPENGNWVHIPTETVRTNLQKDEWTVRVPPRY